MTSDISPSVLNRLDEIKGRLVRLEDRLDAAGVFRGVPPTRQVSGGVVGATARPPQTAASAGASSGVGGAGASGQRAAPASPPPPARPAPAMSVGEAARAISRSQEEQRRQNPSPPAPPSKKTSAFASLQGAGANTRTIAAFASPPRPRPAKKKLDIEREIGGRWFAIGGALVVVIGAGLFLKLALDQGWIGRIDPALRCAVTALFGAALVFTGGLTRTRFGWLAAAGLGAAGLGLMYASAYASYGLFQLVSAPAAFTMLALCSAIGVGVALRWKLASVAILSLCGAYLTPLLLADATETPLVLPLYLLALYAGASSLSGWMGGHFTWARTLAWWATALMGGVWAAAYAPSHPWMALALLTGVWIIAHSAGLLDARRENREAPAPVEGDREDSQLRSMRRRVRFWGGALMTSVATTAWSVALGVFVARSSGAVESWMIPAAWFAMTAMGAVALCGGMRALRDRPRNLLEAMGANLATQAGALLALTIALGFTGWLNAAVWLCLGVSAVAAARWTGSLALRVYGLIVLSFGTLQLVTLEWWRSVGGEDIAGLYITQWMGLAMVGGLAWLVCGRLALESRRDDDEHSVRLPSLGRGMSIACAAIGAVLLYLGVLHVESTSAATCVAWLGLAALLWFGHELERRMELRWSAALGLVGSALLWLWAYAADWSAFEAPVLLHPGLVFGLLIATAAALFARRWPSGADADHARAEPIERAPGLALLAAAGAMVFIATTLEAGRAAMELTADETTRQAAISTWWGLFGVGLVALGFRRRLPAARCAGLALIAVAAGKALVVDMAGVSATWRVVSVVGLGVLMLGVAMVYSRLVQRSSTSANPEPLEMRTAEWRGDLLRSAAAKK